MRKPNVKDMVLIGLLVLITTFGLFSLLVSDESGVPLNSTSEVAPLPPDYLNFQEKESSILGQLAANPENAALISRLGDLYFESEQFERAIAEYVKALELEPDDKDTYNDLGLAYHYTGKYELSVEQLNKGIEIDPDFQRLWLSLGYVHASNGVNESAVPALKRAIEINDENSVGLEAKRLLGIITSPALN